MRLIVNRLIKNELYKKGIKFSFITFENPFNRENYQKSIDIRN